MSKHRRADFKPHADTVKSVPAQLAFQGPAKLENNDQKRERGMPIVLQKLEQSSPLLASTEIQTSTVKREEIKKPPVTEEPPKVLIEDVRNIALPPPKTASPVPAERKQHRPLALPLPPGVDVTDGSALEEVESSPVSSTEVCNVPKPKSRLQDLPMPPVHSDAESISSEPEPEEEKNAESKLR